MTGVGVLAAPGIQRWYRGGSCSMPRHDQALRATTRAGETGTRFGAVL